MSDSIKKLQQLLSRFPTIGNRTAGRFVFYLIRQPKESVDELIAALQELKKNVKLCVDCFNPFESGGVSETPMLCEICQSPARNKQLLCIIEKEADLLTIEATKRYTGLYFILASTRFTELKNRITKGNFTEIIIALNPTPEGRTAAALVMREIGPLSHNRKITRLAQGLPVGGELEYVDEETLESAFEGRK